MEEIQLLQADIIPLEKKGVTKFDFVGFSEAKIIANVIRINCIFSEPTPSQSNRISKNFYHSDISLLDKRLKYEVEDLQKQLQPFRLWPDVTLNRITAYKFVNGGAWGMHRAPEHITHPIAIMFFESGISFIYFDNQKKKIVKLNPQVGNVILLKPEVRHKISVDNGDSSLMCIISSDNAPTGEW